MLQRRRARALGVAAEHRGHHLVVIVEAGGGPMHRADERARPAADHAEAKPPPEPRDRRCSWLISPPVRGRFREGLRSVVASCGIVHYKAQAPIWPQASAGLGQRSSARDVEAQDQARRGQTLPLHRQRQAHAPARQSPAQPDRPAEDGQGHGSPVARWSRTPTCAWSSGCCPTAARRGPSDRSFGIWWNVERWHGSSAA